MRLFEPRVTALEIIMKIYSSGTQESSIFGSLDGPGGIPKGPGGPRNHSNIDVAAVWLAFIIFNSRFDRWAVLGGSGAASSGHFRPILGGPGGVRAGIKNMFF